MLASGDAYKWWRLCHIHRIVDMKLPVNISHAHYNDGDFWNITQICPVTFDLTAAY